MLLYIYELLQTFPEYFRHPACLPSLSLALLYLTVLSFGGQMVTYLISAGFSSFIIALVRSLSVLVEITATWIAPKAMARVGPTRAAMWFGRWQTIWVGGTMTFFWTEQYGLASASGLSAGVILSRIGLWGYDLCAQTIIQNVRYSKLFHLCHLEAGKVLIDGQEVQEFNRGSFSSTEQVLQNVFELLSYVLTIIASRPDQFRYPVTVSAGATFIAGGLYASYLRRKRGHLIHLPCTKTGTASFRF